MWYRGCKILNLGHHDRHLPASPFVSSSPRILNTRSSLPCRLIQEWKPAVPCQFLYAYVRGFLYIWRLFSLQGRTKLMKLTMLISYFQNPKYCLMNYPLLWNTLIICHVFSGYSSSNFSLRPFWYFIFFPKLDHFIKVFICIARKLQMVVP